MNTNITLGKRPTRNRKIHQTGLRCSIPSGFQLRSRNDQRVRSVSTPNRHSTHGPTETGPNIRTSEVGAGPSPSDHGTRWGKRTHTCWIADLCSTNIYAAQWMIDDEVWSLHRSLRMSGIDPDGVNIIPSTWVRSFARCG